MDYSEATDFVVENGTYEVVINEAKQDVFKNSGMDYLQFDLIIRNDITNQNSKNMHIFYRIFPSKKTGKFPKGMLLAVGKNAGIPNNTHFQNLDDYFNHLYHKPLLVTVKNEKWEKNGKSGENLNVKNMRPSAFPNVQHVFKNNDGASTNTGMNSSDPIVTTIDITDDDLPF